MRWGVNTPAAVSAGGVEVHLMWWSSVQTASLNRRYVMTTLLHRWLHRHPMTIRIHTVCSSITPTVKQTANIHLQPKSHPIIMHYTVFKTFGAGIRVIRITDISVSFNVNLCKVEMCVCLRCCYCVVVVCIVPRAGEVDDGGGRVCCEVTCGERGFCFFLGHMSMPCVWHAMLQINTHEQQQITLTHWHKCAINTSTLSLHNYFNNPAPIDYKPPGILMVQRSKCFLSMNLTVFF